MELTQNNDQVNIGTTRQWLAALARAFARKLERATIAPPSVAQLAASQLRSAQIALLDAEAEAERAQHTAAMFRARIERLQRSAGTGVG